MLVRWFFMIPQKCLLSVKQPVVAEDRALRMHMPMGHPPFELIKIFYPSTFGGIKFLRYLARIIF